MNKEQIVQIGILVADIEKAAEAWSRFTGEKSEIFITEKYEVTGATYQGRPCYGRLKQAFFQFSNIQVELVAPYGEESSVWKDCLEQNGEGLHHLAFAVDDAEASIRTLEDRGMPLMQIGHWPAEPKDGTYAYLDARDSLGAIIELLCTE